MNVEMPEVGIVPGNSIWTETYVAYLSAVWRQIYIKTSLPMGIGASFAHKKTIACQEVVAPDLEKTSSLIVSCARFRLKFCCQPNVVTDLLRIYLPTRNGVGFTPKIPYK